MQTSPVAKISFLAVLWLALAFVMNGCKTTPQVDWNSRVGVYTYDQAVTGLGPPDKQAKLSDGKTVAQWITLHGNTSGLSVGTGFFNGNYGMGVGQSIHQTYPDHVLELTFGTNNVLVSWARNY